MRGAIGILAMGLAYGQPVAAQTSLNCSTAGSQLDMNFCAKAGWEQSDAELNRLWRVVKPAADARGQGQQLLDAQRAWLAYRDATCEAEQNQYEGGSIAPMIYWMCLDRTTLQRNAVLQDMLR